MLIALLIIISLVVLNGLFVAAEFAIVGAPRAAIERRALAGERLAQVVHRVLEVPRRQDRYIATAQLGITVASLGLGMYGEHVLADWILRQLADSGTAHYIGAHSVASAIAVSALTYLHIVVGEMVPKSIALQRAEHTVLWITPHILWMQYACYPIVFGLNGLGNLLLKALGLQRQEGTREHLYSPEELELVVRESEAGGLLRAESGRILRELFDFGELTAREVMTPRVQIAGLPLGADGSAMRALVAERPYSRYPVYGEDLDQIIGMVHVKDLIAACEDGRVLAADIVHAMPYVPETAALGSVIDMLRKEETHMAIVIDEHGGTAGVVTLSDLFDEVIGEIDEAGPARPSISRDYLGRLHVKGTVRVEEVGEQLGVALEHPDVDSVSGLVLTLLGRPPRIGDRVDYEGVHFEVTATEGHGVSECIVALGSPTTKAPR
ncbi:MAG: DUF21 domain-containing protein [Luteitalea sp.]|nr:DUF21 domain-containing protein [Luteitalea sp.]